MLLLLNLVLLAGFALAARTMLAARGVSWARLTLASMLGFVLGLTIGGLVVLGPRPDLTGLADVPATDFYVAALPFQLVITMGLVVVFELVRSRPRTRRRLTAVRPLQGVRRRLAIAGRGITVSRVAAKQGLTSRGAGRSSPTEQARALRASIEDLGGVYVKLGQLLATRPDLLPPEAVAELGRLHASVTPLPIGQVRKVLADELGDLDQVFADIEPQPLGSASIAQAHVATLTDGTEVVVKVQRPGLERDVERDLAILDWVADNAERRLPIAASYGVAALADDFAEALRRELDFRNEAHDVAGVAVAVSDVDEVQVPAVFEQYTTPRVLVMERLLGRPLSEGVDAPLSHAQALADALCDSQLRAMMRGQRFHGDPHPGNVLLLDDGRLGLIDFGMTGRLDSFGRAFVIEMLIAIRLRDPAVMYEALVTGGAVDLGENREQVERALAAFMAAHLGSTMISADAMTELLRLTAELGIALPEQASVMFRAIATLVGTLETLCPGYPFMDRVSQAAGVEVRAGMMPTSVGELLQREAATLVPFARRLPRHVDRLASQLERGQFTTRVSLFGTPADVAVVERLLNKALLAVLGLGVLALGIVLIRTEVGPVLGEQDFYLTQLFGWIGLFFGTVLVLRTLLDVLRNVPVVESAARSGR